MANNRDGSGRFKPGQSGNQAGRPRKQTTHTGEVDRADGFEGPAFEAAVERALALRGDGWSNVISGFGQPSRDKRLSSTFCADWIDDTMAQELWRGDPVGARAVEVWPTEMLRAGWEVCVPEAADKERAEEIGQVCEDLGLDEALIESLCYQRAYGGGAILMGINDGRLPSEPVEPARVRSIDWLTTLEPREIQPRYWYANPMAPNFGKVETWMVTPQTQGAARDFSFGSTIEIHESRLLVLNGTRVSRIQHSQRAFWGDSIFVRLFATLREFNSVYESLGVLMHELGTPIWEVENLAQIVTSKDSSLLKNRVMAMDFCKSVIRAVVIAKGEVYRRDQMSFAGVPDVLDRFAQKLSAALDGMPLTMLLGISPTGLGSTGESELKIWNGRVAWKQKKDLRPVLKRFLTLLWGGKPPKKWSIEFAPLSQPTDAETATTRKTAMDTAVAAVDAQILTPEEVRQSMYGGDKYSMEIQLDPSLTAPEEFQEPPAPVAAGMPPGGSGAPPPPGGPPKGATPAPTKPSPRADYDPDQPRDERGRWGEGGGALGKVVKERISGALKTGRHPSEGLSRAGQEAYDKHLAFLNRPGASLGHADFERRAMNELHSLHSQEHVLKDPRVAQLSEKRREAFTASVRESADFQSVNSQFDHDVFEEDVNNEYQYHASVEAALRAGHIRPISTVQLQRMRGVAERVSQHLQTEELSKSSEAATSALLPLTSREDLSGEAADIEGAIAAEDDEGIGDEGRDEHPDVRAFINEIRKLSIDGDDIPDIDSNTDAHEIVGLHLQLQAMGRGDVVPESSDAAEQAREAMGDAGEADDEPSSAFDTSDLTADNYKEVFAAKIEERRSQLVAARALVEKTITAHEASLERTKIAGKALKDAVKAAEKEAAGDSEGDYEFDGDPLTSQSIIAAREAVPADAEGDPIDENHPDVVNFGRANRAASKLRDEREEEISRTTIADLGDFKKALKGNIKTYKKLLAAIDKKLAAK